MSEKKKICVFCSASEELGRKFYESASALGELIGKEGFDLVYGGTDVGMMKSVADATRTNGGAVTGVIPTSIKEMGIASSTCNELIECATMSERKKKLDVLSDAFIALPGGFGTLDEFGEVLANKQLNLHRKPLVLLNTFGYYDNLLKWFETAYQSKCAKESYRSLYKVVRSEREAVVYLLGLLDEKR